MNDRIVWEQAVHRTQFLSCLIESFGYRTYLEIGVDRGHCLEAVHAPFKVGIDPSPLIRQLRIANAMLFCGSSDDFFRRFHSPGFFDLVFIDGLHEHEQVYRDITNALEMLSDNGTIALHDCNPTTEAMQRVPQVQAEWTGDCWKTIARLRMTRDDLQVSVLDTDYGLGVVRRGRQTPLVYDKAWHDLTWPDLEQDRGCLLGLVSVERARDFLAPDAFGPTG